MRLKQIIEMKFQLPRYVPVKLLPKSNRPIFQISSVKNQVKIEVKEEVEINDPKPKEPEQMD